MTRAKSVTTGPMMRRSPKQPRRAKLGRALATLLCALLSTTTVARAAEPATAASLARQHDADRDAPVRGVDFTVPEVDDLADFHGDPFTARLVLYVAGNSYFAMGPLVQAFEQLEPGLAGLIYWETLPPGVLAAQRAAGGTITVGNMTWTARPDVYLAGLSAVDEAIGTGALVGPAVAYATNTLTIMVARGNPMRIAGLADLGRQDLRLAMPNTVTEGVARQIREALIKAGGIRLAATVYGSKVADGSTTPTQIHHRQTPLWIQQGRVDAGVTWQSEAVFQEQAGHPIGHVDIPAAQNSTGVYAAALVADAPHAAAGRAWLAFIRSPEAFAILSRYGFGAVTGR